MDKKIKEDLLFFIKSYIEQTHSKGVVLGMSGGKDSFVAASLCVEALGKDKVFGVIMPNGKMNDLSIAKEECEYLGIKYKVFDIKNAYDEIYNGTKALLETDELSPVSYTNISPRLRMTMLYTIAGTLGYLVVCTSNLSEIMIGYTTKWGDNVGDFAPLANLTKTEVCELGLQMGLPEKYVLKKPEDGLTGKTDEDNLGFSYAEVDEFIRNKKTTENTEKIVNKYIFTAHKRALPKKVTNGLFNYFDKFDEIKSLLETSRNKTKQKTGK